MYLEENKSRYLGREMFNPERAGNIHGGGLSPIPAPLKAARSYLVLQLWNFVFWNNYRLTGSWEDRSDRSYVTVVPYHKEEVDIRTTGVRSSLPFYHVLIPVTTTIKIRGCFIAAKIDLSNKSLYLQLNGRWDKTKIILEENLTELKKRQKCTPCSSSIHQHLVAKILYYRGEKKNPVPQKEEPIKDNEFPKTMEQ